MHELYGHQRSHSHHAKDAYIIRRDSYKYFNPLHIDFHGSLCYTEFNEKECF